jgi:hypothetical protein
MRIRLKNEGRIFEGTANQVVQQMQRTAIFAAHLSLAEYVEWCVQNAARMSLDVKVTGEGTEARCASLIAEMIRVGIADKIRAD